jgi:hypothetical protein
VDQWLTPVTFNKNELVTATNFSDNISPSRFVQLIRMFDMCTVLVVNYTENWCT